MEQPWCVRWRQFTAHLGRDLAVNRPSQRGHRSCVESAKRPRGARPKKIDDRCIPHPRRDACGCRLPAPCRRRSLPCAAVCLTRALSGGDGSTWTSPRQLIAARTIGTTVGGVHATRFLEPDRSGRRRRTRHSHHTGSRSAPTQHQRPEPVRIRHSPARHHRRGVQRQHRRLRALRRRSVRLRRRRDASRGRPDLQQPLLRELPLPARARRLGLVHQRGPRPQQQRRGTGAHLRER